MGLSLRTRLCLPFQLPGMIWKRMVVGEGRRELIQMIQSMAELKKSTLNYFPFSRLNYNI